MKLNIKPGKYIAAVSGGVDSMVMLDLLCRNKALIVIVAHFDHGIRPDSVEDRKFVGEMANHYGMKFVYDTAQLGPRASEEQARNARYAFLNAMAEKYHANGVITAHHQDDMIETALLNMLRGTGRKGLTSLASSEKIVRPLLGESKKSILTYAKKNKLKWREDPSNEDLNYFRNYIRKKLMPKLSYAERQKLVELLGGLSATNKEIDKEIASYLQFINKEMNIMEKRLIVGLSHKLACEAVAEWLRKNDIREFDKNLIERLVISIKTYKAGQKAAVTKGRHLLVGKQTIEII